MTEVRCILTKTGRVRQMTIQNQFAAKVNMTSTLLKYWSYDILCNYIYHLKFTNLFFYFSFIHSIVLHSTHCDWINEFENTLNDFKSSEGNDSIKNIPFLSNLLTSKNEMNCNINMHNFFVPCSFSLTLSILIQIKTSNRC